MSKNIKQIYDTNPITSNTNNDLIYFGQSPYGIGDDAAMLFSNFSAQFSTSSLTDAHIFVGNASNIATDLPVSGDITLINTGNMSINNGVVSFNKIQNLPAFSVLGRPQNSPGVTSNISSFFDGEILRNNSGSLAFGSIDISNTTTVGSSILKILNGGTNSSSQITNGINYYDGTSITSSSYFSWDGSNLTAQSNTNIAAFSLINLTTGSSNFSLFHIVRGDQTNGQACVQLDTTIGSGKWIYGMFQGSASLSSDADDLLFRSFNSGGNTVLGLGYSTYDITIPNGNLLITNVAKTINISSLAASWPVVTNGSKNLVSSNTASSYAFGTTNPSLDTNADTGINLISSTANKAAQLNVGDSGLTATFSIFSGRSSDLNTSLVWTSGTNLKFATQTSGQVANSGYTQIANFDGSGNFTFGNPAGNPTTAARVNINSSTQTISRITFSGQEFLQAATTSNDGIALILGINRTNNKQLWIGDSTRLASSSSNPVIRFLILPNATSVVIDSQSTNGTQLPITFGSSGATTTISASTLNLSGSSVSVNNSNFSVSRSVAGDVISSVINTNAGSTSNAVFQSTTQGASGGDPKCIFTISGVQSWVCGIDNSVNDQFIIGSSTDPGSSDKLIITTGGDITNASGDQIINTAGKTLKVKQGSNACAGTGAVLVGGTVTVNTTAVATGDIILLNCTTSGGTQGIITTSIVNGTSFTLTSSQILDTSTYSWWILKAA